MLKNKKGFTMIEMIIVISIIALLLLLIIPNINEKQKMINLKGCEALKETINSQIYLYEIKHNKLPTSTSDLVKEGFIKDEQTKCKNNLSIVIENGQAKIK
ncbi:competence protein ComGC [Bacilli bacterium PM5-3]|nr:competence protein ComGC [Bacilli bacterium PM5-3]MDH6603077.1 competence protein ComGC [Bacilli bacterium PM5-9]